MPPAVVLRAAEDLMHGRTGTGHGSIETLKSSIIALESDSATSPCSPLRNKSKSGKEGINMDAKRDYYEILGVSRSADDSAIKKAYRKLAKKYHPDTNAGNAAAEERFKEATDAYNILSDPEKRKLYDRFGHAAFDPGAAGSAGSYGHGGPGKGAYEYTGPDGSYQEFHFEDGDMEEILKHLFRGGFSGSADGSFRKGHRSRGFQGFSGKGFSEEGFGGFSEDAFQDSGSGNAFQDRNHGSGFQSGRDLRAELSISFDEAANGCDKVISLQAPDDPSGKAQSLKVHIPAGIDSGMNVRLRGKGMSGGSGAPGDLLLRINVGTKPGFERQGMDVYTTVSIPFTIAVFGGETMVETLYGKVLCRIAEGTQSGTKIRLKGKGIVSMKDPKLHGDQYVTVQIQVPRDLNENAKQKLREYEKACAPRKKGAA